MSNIDEFIPPGEVSRLVGPSDYPRLYVALCILAFACCGRAIGGFAVRARNCFLFTFRERVQVIDEILRLIVKRHDLDPELVESRLQVKCFVDHGDPFAAIKTESGAREYASPSAPSLALNEALSVAGALCVIDSQTEALPRSDRDFSGVNQFIRERGSRAAEHGSALLLLSAYERGDMEQLDGMHVASPASDACASQLTMVSCPGGWTVRHTKHRYSPVTGGLRLAADVYGAPDVIGAADETGAALEIQTEADAMSIKPLFAAAFDAGLKISPRTTGDDTAADCLLQMPGCPHRFQQKNGRTRLNTAVVRLLLFHRKIRIGVPNGAHASTRGFIPKD